MSRVAYYNKSMTEGRRLGMLTITEAFVIVDFAVVLNCIPTLRGIPAIVAGVVAFFVVRACDAKEPHFVESWIRNHLLHAVHLRKRS